MSGGDLVARTWGKLTRTDEIPYSPPKGRSDKAAARRWRDAHRRSLLPDPIVQAEADMAAEMAALDALQGLVRGSRAETYNSKGSQFGATRGMRSTVSSLGGASRPRSRGRSMGRRSVGGGTGSQLTLPPVSVGSTFGGASTMRSGALKGSMSTPSMSPLRLTKSRRTEAQYRALRWREARWLAKIMRQTGKRPQLGLDRLNVGRAVKRNHFIGVFSGYMKIDPFVLCPHLNDFFTGCDTDADNLADPRDMSCIFRILTAPQSGIDINLAYMFDAYSEIKDGRNVTHRNNILKIIATSAVEDEEAAQLLRLSEPLLDRIGQPLPLFVDKEDFVRALEPCKELKAALHEMHLQRLDDDERMRVLFEEAHRTTEIVVQHEERIQMEKAIRFVKNIMHPRRVERCFLNWRERARVWKEKRLRREKGDYHYFDRYAYLYIVWWLRKTKFRPAKKKAMELQKFRMKRRNFRVWQKFWKEHAPIRRIRERYEERQLLRKSVKAEAMRERLYNKWKDEMLHVIYFAIKKEAQDAIDVRKGAAFYFRWVKKDRFRTWWNWLQKRKEHREKRKFDRDADVRAVEEAERKEKERVERERQEEERQAKLERERERQWREKVAQTEAHFEMKRIIAEQKAAREAFLAARREKQQAEFEEQFAQVRQKLVDEIVTAANEFLDSAEGQKYLKKDGVPEVISKIAVREDLTSDQKKKQEGLEWPVVFDVAKQCRKYVHIETGEEFYSKGEADVSKSQFISKSVAKKIARSNLIGKRVKLAEAKISKRRDKELAEAKRSWNAEVIQRAFRQFVKMKVVRERMREMMTLAREQRIAEKKATRYAAAKKIQDQWKGKIARRNLLKMLQALYQTRTDPETGDTYWYNTITNQRMYHMPTLFASAITGTKSKAAEKPDWIYVRKAKGGLNYYKNPSTEDETHHIPPHYHMCVQCQVDFAQKYCEKCTDRYCAVCWLEYHAIGKRADHQWLPVPVKRVKCYYCSSRFAELRCDDCQQSYCGTCTEAVHGADHGGLTWHEVVPM